MSIEEADSTISAIAATVTTTMAASPDPLTLDSVRESVKSRIRNDDAFGRALFSEAIQGFLADDMPTATSVLFDYIDATIGFDELSALSGLPADSVRAMFGPAGDPRAAEFFRVLALLQQYQGIHLEVSAA